MIEWLKDTEKRGLTLIEITGKTLRSISAKDAVHFITVNEKMPSTGTYLLNANGNSTVRPVIGMKQ